MSLFLIIKILVTHYVADFIFQTEWMATNKSKNWQALSLHVLVYSVMLLIIGDLRFALLNGVAHFITDAVTSRVGIMMWASNNRRGFFAVLGMDQLVHYVVLFVTAKMMLV